MRLSKKLKIGDFVRVKTREELIRDNIPHDWDEPYVFTQGQEGIVYRITNDGSYPVMIRFSYLPDFLEEYDKAECDETGYKFEEIVLLKCEGENEYGVE